jgi:hypothetical protein
MEPCERCSDKGPGRIWHCSMCKSVLVKVCASCDPQRKQTIEDWRCEGKCRMCERCETRLGTKPVYCLTGHQVIVAFVCDVCPPPPPTLCYLCFSTNQSG